MKKSILAAVIIFSGLATRAQDLSQTIGLRLGDNDGFGSEISYQKPLGTNRLQLDLGFRSNNNVDTFKLTGTYQWIKDLSSLADGFNWFYGGGAGIGSVQVEIISKKESETFVSATGIIGIEYNFDFPLQLSLDTRPEIGIINSDNDLGIDIALGARYRF